MTKETLILNYFASNSFKNTPLIQITISLNDVPLTAIIDTGSAISFIDDNITNWLQLDRQKTDRVYTAGMVNGSILAIEEFVNLEFSTQHNGEKKIYKHRVLITDKMKVDVLLGLDFCRSHVSYIQFESKTCNEDLDDSTIIDC